MTCPRCQRVNYVGNAYFVEIRCDDAHTALTSPGASSQSEILHSLQTILCKRAEIEHDVSASSTKGSIRSKYGATIHITSKFRASFHCSLGVTPDGYIPTKDVLFYEHGSTGGFQGTVTSTLSKNRKNTAAGGEGLGPHAISKNLRRCTYGVRSRDRIRDFCSSVQDCDHEHHRRSSPNG